MTRSIPVISMKLVDCQTLPDGEIPGYVRFGEAIARR